MHRRAFLATAAACLAMRVPAQGATYSAAVIGHTGEGDFGHGYDQVFRDNPGVSVLAVADPDPAGRERARERAGAARGYADYREMLRVEKPTLVCIAPRRPRLHAEMAVACIEAGARGLFLEKPFTETPAEADRILAAARAAGTVIRVAHHRRHAAEFQAAAALVREGFAGAVREVRFHGKQDARAGGEDLNVLGIHDFDLLREWFGEPRWCQASVLVGDRLATPADVHPGTEKFPVAGDHVHANFGFDGGVHASWHSVKKDEAWNAAPGKGERGKWGFEVLGTRRILVYQDGLGFAFLDSPFPAHLAPGAEWKPLPPPGAAPTAAHTRHPIRSLLHELETGEKSGCSGEDGARAVEMVAAVYQSHFSGRRVAFPLADRGMGWS